MKRRKPDDDKKAEKTVENVEKKDALRSAQKFSIPVPVPGTTTRSRGKVNPPID